jgi:hypothetical protein
MCLITNKHRRLFFFHREIETKLQNFRNKIRYLQNQTAPHFLEQAALTHINSYRPSLRTNAYGGSLPDSGHGTSANFNVANDRNRPISWYLATLLVLLLSLVPLECLQAARWQAPHECAPARSMMQSAAVMPIAPATPIRPQTAATTKARHPVRKERQ